MSLPYTLPAVIRRLFCAFVLALAATPAVAQTDVPVVGVDLLLPRGRDGASVEAGVSGLCVGCSVADENNLVDDDASTFATIRTTLGVGGSSSVAVLFPFEEPAGRVAGFALRDVVGLVDAQLLGALTVSTYLDGSLQESASGSALLRLGLLSSGGVRTVSFETRKPFDEVRLTVGGLGTVATETRVYYVFSSGVAQPPVVDGGVRVGAGTTGACTGCLVFGAGAAVDLDLTNGAALTVPAGADGSAYLDLTFEAARTAGVRAGLVVSSELSDADLVAAVTVQTFLDGAPAEAATGTALTVRPLGDGSDSRVVEFTAMAAFDGVRLDLSALPSGGGTSVVVRYAFTGAGATAGEDSPASAAATLSGAFPNPARMRASFTLTLAEGGPVRVAVYDVLGREVAVLYDGALAAGSTAFRIERSGLPAGVYVYRAAGSGPGGPFTFARRVTLVD